MHGNEIKLQILDVSVTIVIFVVACVIGKLIMNRYNSWICFNGSVIGVLVVGEII